MAFAAARRRHPLFFHHLLRRPYSKGSADATSVPHPAFAFEIRRLARQRRASDIEALLEPLKRDPRATSSEPFLASIVASYASAGMVERAISTLDEIPAVGYRRTALSLNALLSALNHQPRRDLRGVIPDLFSELQRKLSVAPNEVSYGILIKSHCLSGNARKAFPLLREMEAKKMHISIVIYTTILDALYKDGKLEEAEKLWKEMTTKGIKPDVPAYNVRVMYKALNGKPKDVVNLIAEMENVVGLKPDTITYNYLMACYCNHGLYEDAKKVYKGLLDSEGCPPNSATFKNMVSALCKNGNLDGAVEVFTESVKKNKVPDLGTIKLLTERLVKASKLRAAKRVVGLLKNKFPEDFVGEWRNLEKLVEVNDNEEDAA